MLAGTVKIIRGKDLQNEMGRKGFLHEVCQEEKILYKRWGFGRNEKIGLET